MPRAGKNRHRMRGLSILHEDPDVIVVEKAAGILSCATRRGGEEYSVERALTDYVRKGQAKSRKCVYLVHRLDRETSGVMMVAKSPEVQEYFRANWNDITEKTYLACVHGHFEQKGRTQRTGSWRARFIRFCGRGAAFRLSRCS